MAMKLLSKNSAERKINLTINLSGKEDGFLLSATDEDGNQVELNIDYQKEKALKSQTENIRTNLSKTGNTIFEIEKVSIDLDNDYFIPASVISNWRRELTDKMLAERKTNYVRETKQHQQTFHPFPTKGITYLGNVMNSQSEQFYVQHQSTVDQPAFEKEVQNDVPLMFTRHCIKYALGWCPNEEKERHPYKEPFYLVYNNTRLCLSFDCKNCEMKVYKED